MHGSPNASGLRNANSPLLIQHLAGIQALQVLRVSQRQPPPAPPSSSSSSGGGGGGGGGAGAATPSAAQRAQQEQQAPRWVPWHLDRIDQRALRLDGAFNTTANGAGVNVYVVSSVRSPSGIQVATRACI
jgi:hypothetical protein